jgi:pimeloyl-ACP methyl ester carboxylesterase
MRQRLRLSVTWLLSVAAVCLGLSGCQTVVSPTWTIPDGVSTQTVNGYPLAYTARGSGPPVVFVHGVLVDHRYWQTPLDAWTADFRVIAVSMRHFYPEKWDGKGDDFTVEQHAKDLISFIEAIGVPVHLVGWSYGARPAYEVARARPELVKKLVLVEAPVDPVPEPPNVSPNAFARRVATNTAKFFDKGDIDGGLDYAVDEINGRGTWASSPEPSRQIIRDNAWTIVGIGRDVFPKATCAEFASLKMPVLLVRGELTTPRFQQIVKEQSRCLPEATIAVIPKAGHSSALINPSGFKDAIAPFLQR